MHAPSRCSLDVWWTGIGDSLRQHMEVGLGDCTDFMVLLTPKSRTRLWGADEIDARLMRAARGSARSGCPSRAPDQHAVALYANADDPVGRRIPTTYAPVSLRRAGVAATSISLKSVLPANRRPLLVGIYGQLVEEQRDVVEFLGKRARSSEFPAQLLGGSAR